MNGRLNMQLGRAKPRPAKQKMAKILTLEKAFHYITVFPIVLRIE